jgi:hypothetical protein
MFPVGSQVQSQLLFLTFQLRTFYRFRFAQRLTVIHNSTSQYDIRCQRKPNVSGLPYNMSYIDGEARLK